MNELFYALFLMFSFVSILCLAGLCFLLFFIACVAVFSLLIHWISPNNSVFIEKVDLKPNKSLRIRNWLFVIIPITWIIMILLTCLNAWYQCGTFIYLYFISLLFLVVIAEFGAIFSVKKWNTFKISGLLLILLCFLFALHTTIYFGQTLLEEPSLTRKIVDLRLKQNLPQYLQLIKQYESYSKLPEQPIPIPQDFPAIQTDAWKTESGALCVNFGTGGHGIAGDTHHWGYLYISSDDTTEVDHFKRTRKILPKWYRWSD